jgi:hypothetical protein
MEIPACTFLSVRRRIVSNSSNAGLIEGKKSAYVGRGQMSQFLQYRIASEDEVDEVANLEWSDCRGLIKYPMHPRRRLHVRHGNFLDR